MPLPPMTALLLIDVQAGFDDPRWGRRNNPDAEDRMAALLAAWRAAARPVIFVQHLSRNPRSPLAPNQPGVEIKTAVQPRAGEPVVTKRVNSAFIGTDLETMLHDSGIGSLVVVGLTTDHCVSTTARMAGNLGFSTVVVSDATATFDRVGYDGASYPADDIHRLALVSLHGEFATVADTNAVLAWLGESAGA